MAEDQGLNPAQGIHMEKFINIKTIKEVPLYMLLNCDMTQ